MINKSAHSEAFIINYEVAKVDPINSHLIPFIGGIQNGTVAGKFRVIPSIRINIRTLKKVNADGRWLINPMFIEPKAQQADGYTCDEYGLPDQEDTVF